MRRQLLPALIVTIALTVLLGIVYPLVVTGISAGLFGHRADGSLVKQNGKVVGSSLLGQQFVKGDGTPNPMYFQPRPSASNYDALASGATNLGPSNPKLIAPASGPNCYVVNGSCYADTVPGRIDAYRQLNGLAADVSVPIDAVTASGSGLDPNISVANARLQANRVAGTRHLSTNEVLSLIDAHTQNRQWGFLGEKSVNVLELNMALDRQGSGT
jgi:K+-transporting ATPase ATPase C chain